MSVLKYVLGAQKNSLIETVLLSTHNIYFGKGPTDVDDAPPLHLHVNKKSDYVMMKNKKIIFLVYTCFNEQTFHTPGLSTF